MLRPDPSRVFLFISAFFLHGRALAESGLSAARILTVPLNARADGLAGAFTGVPGALDSLGYNPAGLAALSSSEVESTFSPGVLDDYDGDFNYGRRVGPAVLSIGVLYYNGGSVQINPSSGASYTVTAEQDTVGLAGLALPLKWGWSAGVLAKPFDLELAQQAHAAGYAVDGGVLWRSFIPGLSAGASVENMGPPVRFDSLADPLPRTERAGASYAFQTLRSGEMLGAPVHFLITADALKPQDQNLGEAAGLEISQTYKNRFSIALRGGYLFNQNPNAVSFGASLRDGRLFFDYGINVFENIYYPQSSFTLGYRF